MELPVTISWSRNDALLVAIPLLLFLIQAVYFLSASPYAMRDFPLDDAWIHQVYARSFAFADGFAYNPGEQEAGSTSPLWAIVSAPAHWLEGFGVDTVVAAVKAVGVLLGLLGIFFAIRVAGQFTGSKRIGILAGCVLLLEPRLVFSALSGMETTLLFALVMGGIDAMLKKRWNIASVCFGLAPAARPEALLLLPFYAAFLLVLRRRHHSKPGPLAWLIPLIPMGLWSIWCLFVNGHLLPNTFYMKSQPFRLEPLHIQEAVRILFQHGITGTFLLFVGLAAFLVWTHRYHRGSTPWTMLFLIVYPFVHAFAVSGSRAVDAGGYYWTRWFDPGAFLLSFAAATGMAAMLGAAFEPRLTVRLFSRLKDKPGAVRAVSIAGLLCMAIAAPSLLRSMEDRRFHLWSDSRAIHIINVEPGKWIDRTVPRTATVGVNDAGAIRYFGKRYTIDLKGLNYGDFAFGKVTQQQVMQKADWIAVFPDWFRGSDLLSFYEERKSYTIPLSEYTVCDCPGNTHKVIMEKKKEFRLSP